MALNRRGVWSRLPPNASGESASRQLPTGQSVNALLLEGDVVPVTGSTPRLPPYSGRPQASTPPR